MSTFNVPPVFYDFAGGVSDITADRSADNYALIELAVGNLPPILNRQEQLNNMKLLSVCLDELLRALNDQELHDLWWTTDARIMFREGPYTRDFLLDAQRFLQERIRLQAQTPE